MKKVKTARLLSTLRRAVEGIEARLSHLDRLEAAIRGLGEARSRRRRRRTKKVGRKK